MSGSARVGTTGFRSKTWQPSVSPKSLPLVRSPTPSQAHCTNLAQPHTSMNHSLTHSPSRHWRTALPCICRDVWWSDQPTSAVHFVSRVQDQQHGIPCPLGSVDVIVQQAEGLILCVPDLSGCSSGHWNEPTAVLLSDGGFIQGTVAFRLRCNEAVCMWSVQAHL